MRQFRFQTSLAVAIGFLTLGPLPSGLVSAALAAEPTSSAPAPQAAVAPDAAPKTSIDNLFSSLKKERDAQKARVIANEIVGEWNDSGSATINLLMTWSEEAAEKKRKAAAYDFLDQAIYLEPDFAQAWYRRALVHYSDGDTRKAMSDLNSTLEKEPRFFPALASLANILESTERNELALKVWEQYLALYPADKDAQKEASELTEKLAGTRS
ncbi:tetratricopeptide repeat protein [Agrobacterium rubi]|uniref:2-hydroxy-6-oxo-2,4-heptadienoate hydrolase n=1 Tax=Agrobacterium rubi TaxID=28099 RepID=A0AAE7R569_9HYPH|nr:hypothetical protein [Agrobacterium rubi]NTE89307.1 hypothetical protein [Agrobacterium rubi]NTF05089.1 hypothetical protein [Agrobacterium rubi]NTF38859.1 hypothetical protein [Agrobacterium rubi]OCJ43306.1 hypothetical protein A6U92_19980 [Agrobacterium rubi]QTF99821.1 hypothetical protein G6M88_05145 [Agrobacterium rubi]